MRLQTLSRLCLGVMALHPGLSLPLPSHTQSGTFA